MTIKPAERPVEPCKTNKAIVTPRQPAGNPWRALWCERCGGYKRFDLKGTKGNRKYVCLGGCGTEYEYMVTIHKNDKGVIPYEEKDKEYLRLDCAKEPTS